MEHKIQMTKEIHGMYCAMITVQYTFMLPFMPLVGMDIRFKDKVDTDNPGI